MKYLIKKILYLFSNKLLFDVLFIYLIKIITMIISFLITPLYINFFYSNNLLGFWFTAVAFLNWFMFFDIGISGGIRNKIILALKNNNINEVKIIISNAFFSITILLLFLLLIFLFLSKIINWNIFFGITENNISSESLTKIITILFVGVLIRFYSNLVSNILYSIQKPLIPSLMILFSNILILLFVFITESAKTEIDLIYFSIFTLIANNFPFLIVYPLLFLHYLPRTSPSLKKINLKTTINLFLSGSKIFLIQTMMAFLFNFRELLISWFSQADQVVEYQILLKSVGFLSSIIVLGFSPLWSSINKSFLNFDFSYIKKIYRNGVISIFLISLFFLPLLIFLQDFILLWIPNYEITDLIPKAIIYALSSVLFLLTNFTYQFYLGLNLENVLIKRLLVSNLINLLFLIVFSFFSSLWVFVIISTSISSTVLLLSLKTKDFKLDIFNI